MRKTFLIILLSFVLKINAQGLKGYIDVCLLARTAISNENRNEVLLCKDRMKKLKIQEYSDDEFITLFPDSTFSFEGHILFHQKYLVELLKSDFGRKNQIPLDLHVSRRDSKGRYDALITHKIIPEESYGEYIFHGKDTMQLAVIAERKDPIKIQVQCNNEIVEYKNEEEVPDFHFLSWVIGDQVADIKIKIFNESKSPICCVIATN